MADAVQLVMIRLSAAPRALNNFHNASWGSAPLHPRAGSPAEHLGWGARLYAIATLRGLSPKSLSLDQSFLKHVGH